MKLVKYHSSEGGDRVGLLQDDHVLPLDLTGGQYRTLTDILEADDPAAVVELLVDVQGRKLPLGEVRLLAPMDRHEVWAAGVTYIRSRKARMDESASAAAFYDKVYEAPRPELFLKATPHRVAGPDQPVRVRRDSHWTVPEPELALVLNSRLNLVGFTIGNDMSARDIEGENPLYLPQAKTYSQCCGLGPCITLRDFMPPREQVTIRMGIVRKLQLVYEGSISADQMARSYADLIGWLARENTFPDGVILLTGTGIVPPDDFALQAGDTISISIDGIGTLANPVVCG
jgi:2-dehydro-3-deoxy-D-arabinonate dehydratase